MNKYFCSDENVQLISQTSDWKVLSSSPRDFISFISSSSHNDLKDLNESANTIVLMLSLKTVDMFASTSGLNKEDLYTAIIFIIETLNKKFNCNSIIILKPDPLSFYPALFFADELQGFSKKDIYEFNYALDLASTKFNYLKVVNLNGLLTLENSRDIKNLVRTNSRLSHRNLTPLLAILNNTADDFNYNSLPKVIALDLDNTLWNGILREDGLENINIGDLSPLGQLYYRFQELYKSLKNKGILLVLITKNYPEDVQSAFSKYYDMPLKLDDFIIIKASDEPKSSALVNCALELNINLKHFVFIDDSLFERREVKDNCPEVYVPDLPDSIYDWYLYLINDPYISALFKISIDGLKSRTEIYQARAKRNLDQKSFLAASSTDINSWLSSLKQVLTPYKLEKPTQRTVELLQRTNQFNTSGLRYTHEELTNLLKQSHTLFEFNLSDSYGNDGIVSVALIDHSADIPVLMNLVLSCRVFGRHVENAILQYLLKWINTYLATSFLKVSHNKLSTNKAACVFFESLIDQNSFLISENVSYNKELIQIVEI